LYKQTDLKIFELFGIPRIFKDRKYLSSKIIPDELPHRLAELKELANDFGHILRGSAPPNLMIYGPTGSGKTVTVLRVVHELKKVISNQDLPVVVCYAVAEPTEMKTLIALGRDLGIEIPEKGLSIVDAKDKLFDKIGGRDAIVILDEIDKLLRAGRGVELLYWFTRAENISVVGITNMVTVVELVNDARVLSSWNPRKMVFQPYNTRQLVDILKSRAKKAFYESVISDEILEYIASIATRRGGDARYALDLLTFAGDVAVRNNLERITEKEVDKAIELVEREFIKQTVKALKFPEKILLLIVACKDKIHPVEAFNSSNKLLNYLRGENLTQRRWYDYKNNLELYGYVSLIKKGKGRGKGIESFLTLNEAIEREIVVETLMTEFSYYAPIGELKEFLE